MQEGLDLFSSAAFAISRIGNLHQVKGLTANPQQEAGGCLNCTDHRKRFWISKWTQFPYTANLSSPSMLRLFQCKCPK